MIDYGPSRNVQTTDATVTQALQVPLSPGGFKTMRVTVVGCQQGGTGRFRDVREVDVYTPTSGAPTIDGTTALLSALNASSWGGVTFSATLVGTTYLLNVLVQGAASTTIKWVVQASVLDV